MKLTDIGVRAVYTACRSNAAGGPGTKTVTGILHKEAFDLQALRDRHGEIEDMLDELPDGFHAGKGGGGSFLQAGVDRHGDQWTDLQQTMEMLFMLGMAINRVHEVDFFASMREHLPVGMPYYVIGERTEGRPSPQAQDANITV